VLLVLLTIYKGDKMKETIATGLVMMTAVIFMLASLGIMFRENHLVQKGIVSYVMMKNDNHRKPW
jgi:hypothetical protein